MGDRARRRSVTRRAGVIVAALITLGMGRVEAGSKAYKGGVGGEGADTSHTIVLSNMRGIAHGCAITPHVLLTAKHVAIADRAYPDAPATPSTYMLGTERGWGVARYLFGADLFLDLALMASDREMTPYPLSDIVASPGEVLYVEDFSHDKRDTFQKVRREVTVISVLPALLVLSDPGFPGVSGSCLLRHRDMGEGKWQDEIVGVWSASNEIQSEDHQSTLTPGLAVGLNRPLAGYLRELAQAAEGGRGEGGDSSKEPVPQPVEQLEIVVKGGRN